MLGLQGEKLGQIEVRRQRHFRAEVPYHVEDSARAQTAEDAPTSGYAASHRTRRLVEHVGLPAGGVLLVEAPGIVTERGPNTPASARPRAFRQTAKAMQQ